MLSGTWQALRDLGKSLGDTLLPRSCQACGAGLEASEHELCALCWRGMQEAIGRTGYCRRCGGAVGEFTDELTGCNRCRNFKPTYERMVRVGLYRGPLAEMIRKLKFSRQSHSAALLGELLLKATEGAEPDGKFDVISWVPLHWWRRWCRGYNQAELLARRLGRLGGGSVRPLLKRVRWTEPQTHLSRQARIENVRGAFALGWGAQVHGRRILLVDDVLTTGATASEAAGVLSKAGAQVVVAVVAVAGT